MRSPFEIFRKHQKELMVVTVGLAMFAFIILDSLTQLQQVPRELLVVVLALVLGFIFWVIGTQTAKKTGTNKQKEYAISGVLLGAALGILWVTVTRPDPAVRTSIGNINAKQLDEMTKERQIAVEFMRRAFESSVETPEIVKIIQQNPQFARFAGPALQQWNFRMQNAMFNHIPGSPITKAEVVEKYLLLEEADKMGVRVSDESVHDFLTRVTEKKLSQNAYLRIRKDLGVSNSELNRILRDELKAQIARTMLTPRGFRTPLQFWDQYRKLNVKQHIETASLPVSEFIDQVEEPAAGELEKFFEKYKNNYPTAEPSAVPAFAEHQKASVAYLEADFDAVEQEVAKKIEDDYLSEAEIKAALKAIDEGIDEVEKRIAAGEVKPELVKKERENARRRYLRRLLESGGKIKRIDFDVVKYYEDNKSTKYENPVWAPPFPSKKPKEAENPFGADENPARAKKPASNADSAKPGSKAKPFPKQPQPKKKATKTPAGGNSGAALPRRVNPVAAGTFQPEPPLTAVVAFQPKTAGQAKKPSAKQPPAKKSQAAKKKSPAGKVEVVQPPPPDLPGNPPAKPFLLLTDDLKLKIQEQLLDERTKAEINKRLDAAARFMSGIAVRYESSLDSDGPAFDPKQAAADLKKYAAEHGLKYQETELLSKIEFEDASAGTVPFATDPVINIGSLGSHPRVADRLFSDLPAKTELAKRLYRVLRTPNHVVWKTAHRNRRIPEFSETGVKERVKKAWKQMQAQELARKRAQELAEKVRDSGLPMSIALTDTTVTGGKRSHAIKPFSTKAPELSGISPRFRDTRFSWMIDEAPGGSMAPNQRPRKIPPQPTVIPGLESEKIGEDFMKTIFEELGDGDVGVAHNMDKSTFYVVRVFDRTPGGPEGRRAQMSQFLDEDLFVGGPESIYRRIEAVPNYLDLMLREQLWDKYEVQIMQEKTDENESSMLP